MIRLAVLAAAVVAALPASGAASPSPCGPFLCVRITAAGPVPAIVDAWPGQTVWFRSDDPTQPTTVTFDRGQCSVSFAPNLASGCPIGEAGTHTFIVTGFGAGTGAIVVRTVERVTLEAEGSVVIYGHGVRLRGHIYRPPHDGPPPPPYFALPLTALPAAGPATATEIQVAPPSVLSGGKPSFPPWEAIVRPLVRTTYVAEWFGARSAPVDIDVRPHVTMRRRGGRLAIQIRPAEPWGGRHVVVQRLGRDGLWHGVGRAVVGASGTATFAVRSRGTPVRAWVPPAFGYLAGWSAPVDA
jgi:hypothetical protein